MTEAQEAHMESIAHRFNRDFIAKFTKGTLEHSDTQLDKDFSAPELLGMAIYSILQVIYIRYSKVYNHHLIIVSKLMENNHVKTVD